MDFIRSVLRGSVLTLLGVAAPALVGGTPAGTTIDNVATASFDVPGGRGTVTSNVVSLRVDELLGVAVVSADPGPVSASNGHTDQALRFRVTNVGNGPEAFSLAMLGTVGGDDFDPAVNRLVIDSNGNGAFDPGIDATYVAGSNDPVLTPDAGIVVFLLSDMPASAANGARGAARLTATAVTGSGDPGTLFAGRGEGGGDALVGVTRAQASAEGLYTLQSVAVSLAKSAVVLDPWGGTRAVPGSIITYRLVATLAGGGTLANLRIVDAVPAGTSYVAGSITLDAAALTDAAGDDGGVFAADTVTVTLPTAAAGASHAVSFKVRINQGT